jgi:hypothetical protein
MNAWIVISQLQYNLSDQRPITKEHSPLVLPDKVKIISAHGDGASHLRAVHGSGENTSPDGYIATEWTLLINVGACMNSSDVVNKCISVQMTPIRQLLPEHVNWEIDSLFECATHPPRQITWQNPMLFLMKALSHHEKQGHFETTVAQIGCLWSSCDFATCCVYSTCCCEFWAIPRIQAYLR